MLTASIDNADKLHQASPVICAMCTRLQVMVLPSAPKPGVDLREGSLFLGNSAVHGIAMHIKRLTKHELLKNNKPGCTCMHAARRGNNRILQHHVVIPNQAVPVQ